ncbi:MAG TPA: PilZ domain-containing protein [Vicinamibacterales bacterium]|nr:PilZ domain-containing protein [Vicinamibacterales bacterium]
MPGREMTDRRRSPRVMLPEDEECSLQLRTRVRLIDISASGALVESEVPLPVGSKGQLRFALAGASFAPTVQIRRRAGSLSKELNLGAVFTSMDDASRRRLEEFLRKATP